MIAGEADPPATSPPSSVPDRTHRGLFAAVAAAVIAVDQMSKHWALSALSDGPIDLVGSFRLNLVFNDGAAFSLGSGRTSWVGAVALLVSAGILYMGLRARTPLWAAGLAFIFGGALGNVLDRVFRDGDGFLGGHVVDFFDLQWWPVFNVADISLWVGIALLFLSSFREQQDDDADVAEEAAP